MSSCSYSVIGTKACYSEQLLAKVTSCTYLMLALISSLFVSFCLFSFFSDTHNVECLAESIRVITGVFFTTSHSYRLPFCLWPLRLKPGHLFTVMNWHQYLPHHQQDQTNAHDGEGNPQNNDGHFVSFWTTCGVETGKDETLTRTKTGFADCQDWCKSHRISEGCRQWSPSHPPPH